MKKEDLVALGLDETQVNEVFKMRGKEIEEAKATLSTLKADKETAEATAANIQTQLDNIKKEYLSPDEKAAYETKITDMTKAHASEITGIKYENTYYQ